MFSSHSCEYIACIYVMNVYVYVYVRACEYEFSIICSLFNVHIYALHSVSESKKKAEQRATNTIHISESN